MQKITKERAEELLKEAEPWKERSEGARTQYDLAQTVILQDIELNRLRNQVEILQGAYETACEQRDSKL